LLRRCPRGERAWALVRHLLTAAALASLAACGTIAHGSRQTIPITSSPNGARITIDSVPVGVTPLEVEVSRKRDHVVGLTHDTIPAMGTVTVPLKRHPSLWILGSVFLYGVPALVDLSTGGAYVFSPDTIHTTFIHGARAAPVAIARVPGSARATAAALSAVLGFGSGHALLGYDAMGARFRNAQLVGVVMFAVGVGAGFDGNDSGQPVAVAGAGMFIVSRVWELLDVVQRSNPSRAP
jgi:hypothetical protein